AATIIHHLSAERAAARAPARAAETRGGAGVAANRHGRHHGRLHQPHADGDLRRLDPNAATPALDVTGSGAVPGRSERGAREERGVTPGTSWPVERTTATTEERSIVSSVEAVLREIDHVLARWEAPTKLSL